MLTDSSGNSAPSSPENNSQAATQTIERLIVASGTVVIDLDLNRLSGIASTGESKLETLRFDARPNSFFTILVVNNVLRGPESGAVELVATNSTFLPAPLNASSNRLVIEKLPSGEPFDLAVRDERTGFVFFNIEGNLYDYDSSARLLGIKGGRLLISDEFARKLGRPAEAGSNVGSIAIATTMFPIEVQKVTNGATQSSVLPRNPNAPALVPGPDLIVGDLPSVQQFGNSGTQVGLALSTTSCNKGNQEVNWFGYGHNDSSCYSAKSLSDERRSEQQRSLRTNWPILAEAWRSKLCRNDSCGFGCIPAATQFTLGAGCSDPYGAGLNAGQEWLGFARVGESFYRRFPDPRPAITPATLTTAHRTGFLSKAAT